MERIFKAEEQQQAHDAIILMMLEEATTRRVNYLIDVMDFVCKDIVHGGIIEEALLLLDRKEEERVIAERMREGHVFKEPKRTMAFLKPQSRNGRW